MQHSEERLLVWGGASQGEAANFLAGQIDLGAHEAVTPVGIEPPAVPEQRDGPAVVGPADVDHAARGQAMWFPLPGRRPRVAVGGRPEARGEALAPRRQVASGMRHQGLERGEVESPPDFAK